MNYLLLLLFALSTSAYGYTLLEARKLDVEYSVLNKDNRDPYLMDQTGEWGERGALLWDVQLLEYLFWRNNIHAETSRSSRQIRTVGWEYEVALLDPISRRVEVFHYHHSRHVVEQRPNGNLFPLENSYGVRIKLLP